MRHYDVKPVRINERTIWNASCGKQEKAFSTCVAAIMWQLDNIDVGTTGVIDIGSELRTMRSADGYKFDFADSSAPWESLSDMTRVIYHYSC